MQFTFCKFVTIIFYVWEMAQLLFTEKVGRLLTRLRFLRSLKKTQSHETSRIGDFAERDCKSVLSCVEKYLRDRGAGGYSSLSFLISI
jgi:hypothetical protein